MKLLKNKKYYEHVWWKNRYVCEAPVEFLEQIRYQNSTNQTNMPDGRILHQELVFDSIEKEGMQEPLVVVISPEKRTMRLESGNHRIKVAIDRGYTHLPCAFVLYNAGVFHLGNGDHLYEINEEVFDLDVIQEFDKAVYPIYINPQKILKCQNFIFV